jgi:branched-chain amino acid transport system permease protein
VSAIGVSFIYLNLGLFWGGLPMGVFNEGATAAAPKDFPALMSYNNLLGETSNISITPRELLVFFVTIPLLIALTMIIKFTRLGKAMRAVAQNPLAARLMGIDVDRTIGTAFFVYALYTHTLYYQMGFRVGIDAFTAAVLGGIGNLPGAVLGGIVIGLIRAMSDQYIATEWTNVCVFAVLILVLILRPSGLLGASQREKV